MNLVHYVTNFVPCPIGSLEDVLVQVHDQVDGARYLHVDVAVTEQQQMSIVWHDVSVLCSPPRVVHVSSVVCVGPPQDGFRKLLATSTLVVSTCLCVMVYHVFEHEFSIAFVICIGRHQRNLSTDDVVDVVGRLRLRGHTESEVSVRQASLLKLHDVHQIDFLPAQASPQSIHQVSQFGSEDPTGYVGAITCILAVHFGMVANLWCEYVGFPSRLITASPSAISLRCISGLPMNDTGKYTLPAQAPPSASMVSSNSRHAAIRVWTCCLT